MKKLALVVVAVVLLAGLSLAVRHGQPTAEAQAAKTAPALSDLDRLLAPIALYPDQLLAQMLLCAMDPAGLTTLDAFLKSNPTLKGTDLQDAAVRDNFEPSFVALALFPAVVTRMATELDWTTQLGQVFSADKSAVFASIQKLRTQARDAGALKTTPQQQVETQTTSSGQEVIVIEPANPQIVYVPQYNPQTIYVQPSTTTVVVEDNSSDAAVAGLIGFTAGIAIGAAINNDYYYGPYGWHGGGYMYNDAWDDYYDHREDAREDWMDHREDIMEDRGDRRENVAEERTDRRENAADQRGDRAGTAQQQRTGTERQGAGQQTGTGTQAATQRAAGTTAQTASAGTRSAGSTYEARGQSERARTTTTTQQRSGTKSDAFSGYSNGRSERAASSRGQSSRSSSRSRSGGGRRR